MHSTLRRLPALALAGVAALAISACGGDDDGGGGGGGDAGGGDSQPAKTGGTFTMAYTSFPDYMDPALSYTVEGWQAMWNVYTPLLTYKRGEGAEASELIPGLAQAMPEVSEDGKTYTFPLRPDLEYSDGTKLKASDVEHTFKRVIKLESGGAPFYSVIKGVDEYAKKKGNKGDISGIKTDDEANQVIFELNEPRGDFPNIISMNFGGIVPGDTPFSNQTKTPPAGIGPFKIENVRVNRGFELVKNERFPEIGDVPAANPDKIEVSVVKNRRRQTQDVIANQLDAMSDPPAPDQIREVKNQYQERYKEFVTNSTYYFFLNHEEKPFDDVKARQAVAYAVDKRALARLFGGLLEPGCNFLPPGMVGYEKIEPCPYGDPNAEPDVEKARQLVKEAGAEGTSINVYGNDEPESKPVAEYLADVLSQIGFNAKPKIVEASVYFTTIGNQKTKADTGFANWFQDYPHPANFMFLVDPDSIQPTNNQNFGNVNDPKIGDLLDQADAKPLEEAKDTYAEVDKMLVNEAHVVPYGHRKLTVFTSENVNFEDCTPVHPLYYLDFARLCQK